jgi:hypothetical protein
VGSIPITRSISTGVERGDSELECSRSLIAVLHLAHIAQAVEHSLGKGEVTGSSPVVGTTISILVLI